MSSNRFLIPATCLRFAVKKVDGGYRGLAMSCGRWNHSCSFASWPTPTCKSDWFSPSMQSQPLVAWKYLSSRSELHFIGVWNIITSVFVMSFFVSHLLTGIGVTSSYMFCTSSNNCQLGIWVSHLHQVRARLHWAGPVVSSLGHSHICHQQVRRQVAGSECAVGSLQQGEARHAASVGLTFTQRQPVGVQAPTWVQGEAQHWGDGRRERKAMGGDQCRRKQGLDPKAQDCGEVTAKSELHHRTV